MFIRSLIVNIEVHTLSYTKDTWKNSLMKRLQLLLATIFGNNNSFTNRTIEINTYNLTEKISIFEPINRSLSMFIKNTDRPINASHNNFDIFTKETKIRIMNVRALSIHFY